MGNLNTPVLFLVFNRPNTTRIVFEKIREVQPARLYVAADGPREGHPQELNKCEQVREIVTNVDWDCEVKSLFRDKNLGCKYAVSNAIDWFFENEEMGIILEDDCLPNNSFFQFCENLLHKYADEEKIMTISGNNFQPKRRTQNSYYFSKYMHCWGWASWRRAWENYDLKMKDWPRLREENFLSEIFNLKRPQSYWEDIFDRVYSNKIDSWAYIWTYSIWTCQGYNILPEVNLVCNIGIGKDATHTKIYNTITSDMKNHPISFPLKHPSSLDIHRKADKYTQKNNFHPSIPKKIMRRLRKILKG